MIKNKCLLTKQEKLEITSRYCAEKLFKARVFSAMFE